MNGSLKTIPLLNVVIALGPAIVVVLIMIRWSMNSRAAIQALGRMLVQLLLVGFILTYIFETNRPSIVGLVLCVMLLAASRIALGPLQAQQRHLFPKALAAISIAGIPTLLLVTQVVLRLESWYQPDYVVPLAGMIFANCMNAVSLAAERFETELERRCTYIEARRVALKTSLIPLTNSLMAVGLVSIPGMMTGQILSGVAPLVAVRYQIVVMSMIFGSAGIASASYLMLLKPRSECGSGEDDGGARGGT